MHVASAKATGTDVAYTKGRTGTFSLVVVVAEDTTDVFHVASFVDLEFEGTASITVRAWKAHGF